MSTLRKALILALATLGATAITVTPAHGMTNGGSLCVPIAAQGAGQDFGDHTTATITTHGLLLGTTRASFTITGASGAVVSFVGPIDFMTPIGTLTAQLTGTLDSSTGAFESRSTSLTGTGIFRHVTGNVTLNGVENLATGSFTETVRGKLCVALPH